MIAARHCDLPTEMKLASGLGYCVGLSEQCAESFPVGDIELLLVPPCLHESPPTSSPGKLAEAVEWQMSLQVVERETDNLKAVSGIPWSAVVKRRVKWMGRGLTAHEAAAVFPVEDEGHSGKGAFAILFSDEGQIVINVSAKATLTRGCPSPVLFCDRKHVFSFVGFAKALRSARQKENPSRRRFVFVCLDVVAWWKEPRHCGMFNPGVDSLKPFGNVCVEIGGIFGMPVGMVTGDNEEHAQFLGRRFPHDSRSVDDGVIQFSADFRDFPVVVPVAAHFHVLSLNKELIFVVADPEVGTSTRRRIDVFLFVNPPFFERDAPAHPSRCGQEANARAFLVAPGGAVIGADCSCVFPLNIQPSVEDRFERRQRIGVNEGIFGVSFHGPILALFGESY